MYRNLDKAGKKIVILGGGLVGVELGLYLSMNGGKVTILEMLPALSYGAAGVHGAFLDMRIPEYGLDVALGMRAAEITDQGVVGADTDGNETLFEADTVVYAVGLRPEWDAANALRACAGGVLSGG